MTKTCEWDCDNEEGLTLVKVISNGETRCSPKRLLACEDCKAEIVAQGWRWPEKGGK